MAKNPTITLKFGDERCEFYCNVECSICGTTLEYVQDNWSTNMLTLRTNPCPKCTAAVTDRQPFANATTTTEFFAKPVGNQEKGG